MDHFVKNFDWYYCIFIWSCVFLALLVGFEVVDAILVRDILCYVFGGIFVVFITFMANGADEIRHYFER